MFYLDTKTVPRRTSRQIEQRIHEKPVRRPRIPSSVQVSGISEQVSDIGTLVWPGHQVLVCPVFLRGYRACSSVWLERALDKREVGGSSPPWPTILLGGLAQLGERLICIQEVVGSIPISSTIANYLSYLFFDNVNMKLITDQLINFFN